MTRRSARRSWLLLLAQQLVERGVAIAILRSGDALARARLRPGACRCRAGCTDRSRRPCRGRLSSSLSSGGLWVSSILRSAMSSFFRARVVLTASRIRRWPPPSPTPPRRVRRDAPGPTGRSRGIFDRVFGCRRRARSASCFSVSARRRRMRLEPHRGALDAEAVRIRRRRRAVRAAALAYWRFAMLGHRLLANDYCALLLTVVGSAAGPD